MLPKMNGHTKGVNQTKYMSFFIKQDEFLEKYTKILDKVSNCMKKRFDCEPVYNGKYLKTKIKHYESKVCKNFDDDRIPKEGFHFICLSLILIDSVLKAGKSYYYQVFFEEYIIKEKR